MKRTLAIALLLALAAPAHATPAGPAPANDTEPKVVQPGLSAPQAAEPAAEPILEPVRVEARRLQQQPVAEAAIQPDRPSWWWMVAAVIVAGVILAAAGVF